MPNQENMSNLFTNIKKYLWVGVASMLALSACQPTSKQRTVSVSILPQKYFIEKIAGDYLKVNVMVPPGMNPATCDLSTEQLKKLYDSDLCFTIGYLPFELTHLYPVLEQRQDIRTINHSEGLPLLAGSCSHSGEGHHHGGVDPHIWLSPKYAAGMANTVYLALSEQYPEQAETFRHNYESLSREIDSVAQKVATALEGKQGGVFLIYHPVLTYFAADYDLKQIAIEDEGKEPNPAHLKATIDLAKEKNIHIVFIQNQFDTNNARSIAQEIQGKVIPIDPLAENWTQEMCRLIDLLKENL